MISPAAVGKAELVLKRACITEEDETRFPLSSIPCESLDFERLTPTEAYWYLVDFVIPRKSVPLAVRNTVRIDLRYKACRPV